MKDGVDIPVLELVQQPAGVLGRRCDDGDAPTKRLLLDLGCDRQRAASAGPDDQRPASPWQVLCGGQRCVAVPGREGLRRLLVSATNHTGVDDDVVQVAASVDLELPEAEQARLHRTPALGGSHDRVQRPGSHACTRYAMPPPPRQRARRYVTTILPALVQHRQGCRLRLAGTIGV